jgi:7,8-dihydropterin-6-yl-methyl-4-(beta-D-ribofuranosyl)aminobenzene 5'-phosphate synthase
VHITTLMDNSCDALLPDEGLVRRSGLSGTAAPLR